MLKRIFLLLLCLCLVLSAAPTSVGAAAGAQITADTITVPAGSTAWFSLSAENLDNVATMEIYVYYDPDVFTISGTEQGYLLSESQVSVNTAEPGTVKLVAMSLDGITGSDTLLTLELNIKADCEPGKYPIQVAVGGAYDTSLKPITIGSQNGSITVSEPVETEYFSFYAAVDHYELQKGDILTCSVFGSYQEFISGDFLVEYDHTLFAFESLQIAQDLLMEGAIHSVNSSVKGQVRLVYASDTPVQSYTLFSVKLRVIADVETYSSTTIRASNIYRPDLTQYLPRSTDVTNQLHKLPDVIDLPDAFLQTELLEVGKQSQSVFCLEAGAGVAAADFALTYDPEVMRCVGVTVTDEALELGAMVVVNDNYGNGSIRFSYIHMDAYDKTDVPIVTILWEPIQSPRNHYQIKVNATGVVDPKQNPVALEMLTDEGCIYEPVVTLPSCVAGGYTTHICRACEDQFQDSFTAIAPNAHFVQVDGRQWVDSITAENDPLYPFEEGGAIFRSTNHDDNSDAVYTITALYDCAVELRYRTSSEENYE